jgi:hypothetical protein
MTVEDPLAQEWARAEQLADELRRMSGELTKEKQKRVRLEESIVIAATASFAAMRPVKVKEPKEDRRTKQAEVAYPYCADWHIGFDDLATTERRVHAYQDRIVEFVDIHRSDHPVEQAHIPFMGDICHGEQIYPASPYEQTMNLIDQAVTDGAQLVCDFLVGLLPTFKKIHVPWQSGNHGWLGPRKGGVYDPDSNLDRAMGLVVERRLMAAGVSPSRITFDIPRARRQQFGSMSVDRVGEWAVLLLHGQQLKGGSSYGGLPFYGFSKKGLSYGHLGDHGTLPPFKDISVGHWHQVFSMPIMSQQLRGCGTLQSETSFEVETLAAFSRPAQLLTFIHPVSGRVTSEHRIDLD